MRWHYNCPECGKPTDIQWEWLEEEVTCVACNARHYPPTPHEDHYAYVDDDEKPPQEMEEAVIALRGAVCAVPGCYHERTTVVMRKPTATGGKISVDNLIPVCERHGKDRGDAEYNDWLAAIRQQDATQEPAIEFTLTASRYEPEPGKQAAPIPPNFIQPIGSGPMLPAQKPPSEEPMLLAVVPFWRGPVNRVVLDYDWETKQSGRCRLYLIVWPRGDEPVIKHLGGPKFAGRTDYKEHLGVAGDKGNYQLELPLPEAPGGRWTAAIALADEGCGFRLGEYVIYGMP